MFRCGPYPPSTLGIGATERARMGNRVLPDVFSGKPKLKMVESENSLASPMGNAPPGVGRDSREGNSEIAVTERIVAGHSDERWSARAPIKADSANPRRTEQKRAMAPAAAGFIIADGKGHPIYANSEAKTILTYPEGPRGFRPAWIGLRKAIFPALDQPNPSAGSTCRTEITSGRRKYLCLAISLDKSAGRQIGEGSVAIVLERHREASSAFARAASQQFHLTERERQVVEFLIRGLTNKEIAARMQISPNTVRAFVRMVMGKLGISTRSGIVGMVFRDLHSLPTREGN